MIDAGARAAVAAASFVVAVAPGPAMLGCAAVSVAHGRRAGLMLDRHAAHFWPVGERLPIIAALTLGPCPS